MRHSLVKRKNQSPERQIETTILQWLGLYQKVFAWKNVSTGTFYKGKGVFLPLQGYALRGTADIFLILEGGKFGAIEVKTPKGLIQYRRYSEVSCRMPLNERTRQSWIRAREQAHFINTVNVMGGVAGVVCSLPEAQRLLDGHM